MQQKELIQRKHDWILGAVLDLDGDNCEIGKKLRHSEEFWNCASPEALRELIPKSKLTENDDMLLGDRAKRVLERCSRSQISLVFLGDPDYPSLLSAIDDPPAMLFFKGRPEIFEKDKIAIVGSRRAGAYGERAAYETAGCCAERGFAIVSGMAVGIDAAAHKGALDQKGATVAVMAGGLDECYPKCNAWLFHRVEAEGLVISEYPPGEAPLKWHFVRRNRIVSGLSEAVVVAQAGVKSGSLITARLAAEQGRDVYCVPGSIFDAEFLGSHRLIQDGANVLTSPDMLCAGGFEQKKLTFSLPERAKLVSEDEAAKQTVRMRNQTEEKRSAAGMYRWLYDEVDTFGRSAEWLIMRCAREAEEVQRGLTYLELKGLIRKEGSIFIRT